MIDLYTWSTPNGRKVSIMLEELGLPYEVYPIDITKGEQFSPDFLAISPNNKIPAIVDEDGTGGFPLALFESGAILIYLAEKARSDLLPLADPRARITALQWLMFQMGSVGPMFGQAHHFLFQPEEDVPYAKKRYHDEARRLYEVMNGRLHDVPYLAEEYSIADIATYPWVARHKRHQVDLDEFPDVKRWFDVISGRPAVVRGMAVPA